MSIVLEDLARQQINGNMGLSRRLPHVATLMPSGGIANDQELIKL